MKYQIVMKQAHNVTPGIIGMYQATSTENNFRYWNYFKWKITHVKSFNTKHLIWDFKLIREK